MKGRALHFANKKILYLTDEESQYFLDVSRAHAISGYGSDLNEIFSVSILDRVFFSLYQENGDLKDVVELMFQKHYSLLIT